MEKTLARAIYKAMEPGREYTTSDLMRLIDDDYYKYVPRDKWPGQVNGAPVNKVISAEMWKAVKAGYVRTYTAEASLPLVRGLRYGATPTAYQRYNIRYWVRVK